MTSRLWKFLTTDISELISGDVIGNSVGTAEAIFELAEVLDKEGQNVQKLAPLVGQIDSLLDVLNSPLAEIIEKGLPFVSIATGLLKFYFNKSKRPLTLTNCVALVSQAAYLESLKSFLNDEILLQQIGQIPTSERITQQTQQLAKLNISEEEARRAVTSFPSSMLAKKFGEVAQARLVQAGLEDAAAQMLISRVAWRAPQYMNEVWAISAEAVKHLGQPTFDNWRQEQAKYQDIDDYLTEKILPGPDEKVFNEEALTFCDIYVSLEIQLLNEKGAPIHDRPLQDLETWATQNLVDSNASSKILFIQGEAGRGKSVFCRMFADWLRRALYPAYIPILVRLRHVKVLENTLTQTLANYLENQYFVSSDSSWLTDDNTRFLFLLDGFDELLLEGRESGGLKEFLQQVAQFQQSSHHRFLITGRPLSLQGVERLISQIKNIERAELQHMSDEIREVWYKNWATQFGQTETSALTNFLSLCPEDIQNSLAREPLLLYLLGRMHREKRLRADMFEGAVGTEAKVIIYNEAVRWVIEEQRQEENFRQVGLDAGDIRRALAEAAVCVVHSGNEITKVSFLESRLIQDQSNPVYELLKEARKEVDISQQKLLNNLLTTFYIKPASGDREGSVEFAHKSFGEFLFAERLRDALEEWSQMGERRRGKYLVPPETMHWEIYDLLGYGGLTSEIVQYLWVLLTKYSNFKPVTLFERLHDFYLRWWEGEFINAAPDNLPQRKMLALREQISNREEPLGLRQVDVVTGMNVMILLLELHRYGQSKDQLKETLAFYPCGVPNTSDFDRTRLHRIISYGECLRIGAFNTIVMPHFSGINLSRVVLHRTDFTGADLSGADLSRANLSQVNLSGAILEKANLTKANLSKALLRSTQLVESKLIEADLSDSELDTAQLTKADLSGADLSNTCLMHSDFEDTILSEIHWSVGTQWIDAVNLHQALDIPTELQKEPVYKVSVLVSKAWNQIVPNKLAEAVKFASEARQIGCDEVISSHFCNELCWHASLEGHANEVIWAAEKTLAREPQNKMYRDSRVLLRMLIGDLQGALEDLKIVMEGDFIESHPMEVKQRRQKWMEALKSGQNPLTLEELEALRISEGTYNVG